MKYDRAVSGEEHRAAIDAAIQTTVREPNGQNGGDPAPGTADRYRLYMQAWEATWEATES